MYRSILRGRVVYAAPGYVLEQTPTHVVTATLLGSEYVALIEPRAEVFEAIRYGRERTEIRPWHSTNVVWRTEFGEAAPLPLGEG